jgi:hypothetical protein
LSARAVLMIWDRYDPQPPLGDSEVRPRKASRLLVGQFSEGILLSLSLQTSGSWRQEHE